MVQVDIETFGFRDCEQIIELLPEALRGPVVANALLVGARVGAKAAKPLAVRRIVKKRPRGITDSVRAVRGRPEHEPSAVFTYGSWKKRGIKAPHAHLVERGHDVTRKKRKLGGKVIGKAKGRFILRDAFKRKQSQIGTAFEKNLRRNFEKMLTDYYRDQAVSRRNQAALRRFRKLAGRQGGVGAFGLDIGAF